MLKSETFPKTLQYYKFCAYGFLKNLRFFDVFFLLFLREAGLSYLQIGTLYSVRQVVINILEIPSGIIADFFGRRNALVFSMFSYLVSFAIFYFSEDYLIFMLAMGAFGIGEAFRSGTHKAMILGYLKINNMLAFKTRYYGSTRGWSQFGSAISSLAAMLLYFYSGNYRFLFLASFIPYLIDLIMISTYPDSLNGDSVDTRKLNSLKLIYDEFKLTLRSFIDIFSTVKNVKSIFSAAAYIALFKGAKDYLQPILKITALGLPFFLSLNSEKRTALLIGVVYFAIFLMTSTVSRHAWQFEKRVKNLPSAINYAYLLGVSGIGLSGLFLLAEWHIAATFSFIALYLVQNLRRPLMVSYLSDIIESRVMASGLSAESQLETALVALYAPLLGYLIDSLGLAGGMLLSSVLFLILFPFTRLTGK